VTLITGVFETVVIPSTSVIVEYCMSVEERFARWNQAYSEYIQALADISRSALYRQSNETRAPTANPPNSAQLEGTPITPHVTYGSVQ